VAFNYLTRKDASSLISIMPTHLSLCTR